MKMKTREYVRTGLYVIAGLILAAALLAEWVFFGILLYCWYT